MSIISQRLGKKNVKCVVNNYIVYILEYFEYTRLNILKF